MENILYYYRHLLKSSEVQTHCEKCFYTTIFQYYCFKGKWYETIKHSYGLAEITYKVKKKKPTFFLFENIQKYNI